MSQQIGLTSGTEAGQDADGAPAAVGRPLPLEQEDGPRHAATSPAAEAGQSGAPADGSAAHDGEDFAALDSVDFLDDIDFSLEDVESRIAPLALAHR